MASLIRFLPILLSIVLTFFQLKGDKQKTELVKAQTDNGTSTNQVGNNSSGFKFSFWYVIILIVVVFVIVKVLKNLEKAGIDKDPKEYDLKARKLRQAFNPSGVDYLIDLDFTDTDVVMQVASTIKGQSELNQVAKSYDIQFSDNLSTRLDKELTPNEVTKFNSLVASSSGGVTPSTIPKVKSKFGVFPLNSGSAINWYKNKINGAGGYDTEKTVLGKQIGVFVKNVSAKGLVWAEVEEQNIVFSNRLGIISQSQCVLKKI